MFDLKAYLKAPTTSEPIEHMTFAEMLKVTGATSFVPDEGTRYGSRVHLYKGDVKNPANRLFAIKLGKTVKVTNSIKTKEGFKELIKNHIVYHGIATKDEAGQVLATPRPWVSFGKAGELGEQIVFTADEMLAELVP